MVKSSALDREYRMLLETDNVMDSPFVVSAGQLAVGTCEIVMLNRDSSVPRCTIAHQTARCACKRGQIAGTTKARPACVDGECQQLQLKQWCEMAPCLEGEVCGLLFNRSGWTCTKGSGHIKTVTVRRSLTDSCMEYILKHAAGISIVRGMEKGEFTWIIGCK
uniref:TAFA chemokine like family member 5, like n=1 Tax=Hucho hucho TaxID=62062 RepID=A0A4W5KAG9_9TELE